MSVEQALQIKIDQSKKWLERENDDMMIVLTNEISKKGSN